MADEPYRYQQLEQWLLMVNSGEMVEVPVSVSVNPESLLGDVRDIEFHVSVVDNPALKLIEGSKFTGRLVL
ncbi:hypothetical protein [Marinobacter lipolyticus]|uniref:hypothetical protein n=1 Tax=Marinobacter lipolyticus TaxID=209639 RepID=UPI003A8D6C2A